MKRFHKTKRGLSCKVFLSLVVSVFLSQTFLVPGYSQQQILNMPAPGSMLAQSPAFTPPLIKAITIDPTDALKFDFIIDTGDQALEDEALRAEADKLIKYFMAALTVPSEELWVNLSPYEKERIIPRSFGYTEMGRDLLVQDYVLKQMTASLMYPESDLGREFWARVKQKAKELYGSEDIPMNAFNKIWIIPADAAVLEQGNNAIVLQSRLKVMLEEDYLALKENLGKEKFGTTDIQEDEAKKINSITHDVVYQLLLPEIEKEVNEGANFANLRQIYNAMILATWYKQNLKQSFLSQAYVDQNKIVGVDVDDPFIKERIFEQYLSAFQKGTYNYSKQEFDFDSMTLVPKQYYSGGFEGGRHLTVATEAGTRRVPRNVTLNDYVRQLPQQEAAMITRSIQPTGEHHRVSVSLRNQEPARALELPDITLATLPSRMADDPGFRRDATQVLQRDFNFTPRVSEQIANALDSASRQSPQAFNDMDRLSLELTSRGIPEQTVTRLRETRALPQIASYSQQRSSFSPDLASTLSSTMDEREMSTALSSALSQRGVREPARVAQAIVDLRRQSPQSFSSPKQMENALVERGRIDAETARAVTDPAMITQINRAVTTRDRLDSNLASLPTRAAVNRTAMAGDIRSALMVQGNMMNAEADATTDVLLRISERSPAAFLSPRNLEDALVEQGVTRDTARQVTRREVLDQIVRVSSSRQDMDVELASLPARISDTSDDDIKDVMRTNTDLSAPRVDKVTLSFAGLGRNAQTRQAFVSPLALQQALVQDDVDMQDAAMVTSRPVLQQLSQIQPRTSFDTTLASIPTRIAADRTAFERNFDTAYADLPDFQRTQVKQAMIDMATTPGSQQEFGNLDRLQNALVSRGIDAPVAQAFTAPSAVRQLTQTVKSQETFESTLRLMPVRISANESAFRDSARALMENSAIDRATQDVVISGLTDISRSAPRSFNSETELVNSLRSRNVPEFAIAEIRQQNVLPRLAAISQSPNFAVMDKGTRGGIDFNTALLELVVEKEGAGVTMTVASNALDNLNLGGFEPVITGVDAIQSLQQELGLDM